MIHPNVLLKQEGWNFTAQVSDTAYLPVDYSSFELHDSKAVRSMPAVSGGIDL
jgi:hypothetical protein